MLCPNCGAKNTGNICEYCGSHLVNENNGGYKPFSTYNYNHNYTYNNNRNQPFAANTGKYEKGAIPPPNPYQPENMYYQPGVRPKPEKSDRNLLTCFFLCLFLGWFGVHRFYVGKVGTGILYCFTEGLFCVGWIVDLIIIICGGFRDGRGRKISWS